MNLLSRRQILRGLLLPLLSSASLWARADPPQGKGQGKGHSGHGKKANEESPPSGAANDALSLTLTATQARLYAEAVAYTGQKPLPPGIRKNLARGKKLPPGIARQLPPNAMLSQLPGAPPGHEWRVCGTDLVLVVIATAVVAAVYEAVFR
jgi:hypothetical protein